MSTQIENRVVRMEFDNAQFEKNIKVTSDTLTKFEEKISMKNGAKAFSDFEKDFSNVITRTNNTASKFGNGFKTIQTTINNITFKPIENAIEGVKTKFSTLQVLGITAVNSIIQNISKSGNKLKSSTLGQILSGGQTRSLNIENAKFKIKGLVKDTGDAQKTLEAQEKLWNALYEDMDHAVKGTAYGIDQAASAAAQLAASNIEAGDDMKAALRAISGVAAMTGSTYDDIASIFTTAAGKGKVQADELNRISYRGINAVAALAEQLNTTEDVIHDMASKGAIDFKTFATAMDNAFGEQATKADETYQGAMANYKAALSRIGEPFFNVYHDNMKKVYLSSKELVNNIKGLIIPKNEQGEIEKNSIIGVFSRGIEFLRKKYETGVENVLKDNTLENAIKRISDRLNNAYPSFEGSVNNLIDTGKNLFTIFKTIARPIQTAINDMFPSNSQMEGIANITSFISKVSEKLKTIIENIVYGKAIDANGNRVNRLYNIFRGIGSIVEFVMGIFDAGYKVVKKFMEVFSPVGNKLTNLSGGALDHISNFFSLLTQTIDNFLEPDKLDNFVNSAGEKIEKLKGYFDSAKQAVQPAIDFIKENGKAVKDSIKESLFGDLSTPNKISENVKKTFGPVKDALKSGVFVEADAAEVNSNIDKIGEPPLIVRIINRLSQFFEWITDKFHVVKDKINEIYNGFKSNNTFGNVWEGIKSIFSKIGDIFSEIGAQIGPAVQKKSKSFLEDFGKFLDYIKEWIHTHDLLDIIHRITKIFATGGFGALLFKLSKKDTINTVTSPLKSLSGMFDSIGSFFKNISASAQKTPKKSVGEQIADVIKAIALLIGAIAASIWIISTIKPAAFERSIRLFEGIAMMLVLVMIAIGLIIKNTNKTNKELFKLGFKDKKLDITGNSDNPLSSISRFVLSVGAGIVLMSLAFKTIGKLNEDQFNRGMLAISTFALIISAITAIILSMSKTKGKNTTDSNYNFEGMAKLISKISTAFIKMAVPVILIGKFMEWEQMWRGIIALGLMGVAIAGLMYATKWISNSVTGTNKNSLLELVKTEVLKTNKDSNNIFTANNTMDSSDSSKVITTISNMAEFIKTVSNSFVKLGAVVFAIGKFMEWDQMWKGIIALGAIGSVIAILMLVTKWLSDSIVGTNTSTKANSMTRDIMHKIGFNKMFGSGTTALSNSITNEKIVTKLDTLSSFISSISKSVLTVGAVVFAIGKFMNWEQWKIGISALIAITGVITLLSVIGATVEVQKVKDFGTGMSAIAVALGIAALAFMSISQLSWEGIGKGLAAIIPIMMILGAITLVTGLTKTSHAITDISKAIMFFGIAVAAFSIGMYTFIKAWDILSTVNLDPDKLVGFFDKLFLALPKILKGFVKTAVTFALEFLFALFDGLVGSVTELISPMAKFISALLKGVQQIAKDIDIKEIIKDLVAIGLVFVMVFLLTRIAKDAKKAIIGLAVAGVLIGTMAVIFDIMLKNTDVNGVIACGESFALAVGALVAAVWTCSEVGKGGAGVIKATLIGIAAMALVVAGFMVFSALIGLLSLADDKLLGGAAKDRLKEGIALLADIAKGVGEMIGNFVGSISRGALPQIGDALNGFMSSIAQDGGFLDASKKIDIKAMEGVIVLAGAIAALMAALTFKELAGIVQNPLQTIISWVAPIFGEGAQKWAARQSPLVTFGMSLAEFAPYLSDFFDGIKNIDGNKLKAITESIGISIYNLEKNIPYQISAFWGFFTAGKKNLKTLGEELKDFAIEYSTFVGIMSGTIHEWDGKQIANFTSDQFKAVSDMAISIGNMIGNFSNALPDEAHIKAFAGLFGISIDVQKKSLSTFAEELKDAAPNFKLAISKMKDLEITEDDIKTIQGISGIITSFAQVQSEDISRIGGIVEAWAGKPQSLSDFANQIKDSVPAFVSLSKALHSSDITKVEDNQQAALESVLNAASSIMRLLPEKEEWDKKVKDESLQEISDFFLGGIYQEWGDINAGEQKKGFINRHYIGMVDILISLFNRLNSIEIKQPEAVRAAVELIGYITNMFAEIMVDNSNWIDTHNDKNAFEAMSNYLNSLGVGINKFVSALSSFNMYNPDSKMYGPMVWEVVDEKDVTRLKTATEALKLVFDTFQPIQDNVDNNKLFRAITTVTAGIDVMIDTLIKAKDIEIPKADKVKDFIKMVVDGFNDVDEGKLKKVNEISEALKNLALASTAIITKNFDTSKFTNEDTSAMVTSIMKFFGAHIVAALIRLQNEVKERGTINGVSIANNSPIFSDIIKCMADAFKPSDSNPIKNALLQALRDAYIGAKKTTTDDTDSITAYNFVNLGKLIINAMVSGIEENKSAIIDAAVKIAEDAYNATYNGLEAGSPSRSFMRLGKWAAMGFAIGINGQLGYATNAASNMAAEALAKTRSVVSTFPTVLSGTYTPTIVPVMSTKNAVYDAKKINAQFTDPKIRLDESSIKNLNDVTASMNASYDNKIQVDNSDIIKSIEYLGSKITSVEELLANTGIYLDGDTLVGGIANKMDRAFAIRQYNARRGN